MITWIMKETKEGVAGAYTITAYNVDSRQFTEIGIFSAPKEEVEKAVKAYNFHRFLAGHFTVLLAAASMAPIHPTDLTLALEAGEKALKMLNTSGSDINI